MQRLLARVDELDEPLDPTGIGEVVFLVLALVAQSDAHAIVEKAQFAQALGQDLVVKVDVREDLTVRQEVNFGSPLFGIGNHLHGRNRKAIPHRHFAILRYALLELLEMNLAFPADRQAQPFAQPVDAADTDPMQAAGYLVAVLIELATSVQFGQRDFGR